MLHKFGWYFSVITLVAISLFGSIEVFAQTSGTFTVVKGDVQVTTKGITERAKVGKRVFPADVITAGPDSRAKIVMADKNIINISPDTKLALEKYIYDPASGDKQVSLDVVYGKVRATVEQKYDGDKNKFNIKTPVAVAGVRGTDFLTSYSPKTKETKIITFEGKVAVGTPGPQGQILNPVVVAPGQMTTASQGAPPTPPVPVPVEEFKKVNSESQAEVTKQDSSGGSESGANKKEDQKEESKEDSKKSDVTNPDDNKQAEEKKGDEKKADEKKADDKKQVDEKRADDKKQAEETKSDESKKRDVVAQDKDASKSDSVKADEPNKTSAEKSESVRKDEGVAASKGSDKQEPPKADKGKPEGQPGGNAQASADQGPKAEVKREPSSTTSNSNASSMTPSGDAKGVGAPAMSPPQGTVVGTTMLDRSDLAPTVTKDVMTPNLQNSLPVINNFTPLVPVSQTTQQTLNQVNQINQIIQNTNMQTKLNVIIRNGN